MANLVPIVGSALLPTGTFEVKLIRDAQDNVHLLVGFYAKSKKYGGPGTGDDNKETVIERGRILCASPKVAAEITSDDRTGFAIDIVIDSKKPSTGSGASPEEAFFSLLDHFDDKEFVANIKNSIR